MPPLDREVLIYDAEGDMVYADVLVEVIKKGVLRWENTGCEPEVTHWMPLPNPPDVPAASDSEPPRDR